MGRPRKSDADKLAEIIAKFDLKLDEPLEVPENDYNHNNAVAIFARAPEHFVVGVCKNCGSNFAHNQPIPIGTKVGFCSDTCRKLDWEKSTGIKWASVEINRRDRWDGDTPMIITPEQYNNLKQIAEWFNKNQTSLEIVGPEPTEEQALEVEEFDWEFDLGDSSFPLVEDQNVPNTSLGVVGDFSLIGQENQYPAEAHTSPHSQPDLLTLEQTTEVDDFFGF